MSSVTRQDSGRYWLRWAPVFPVLVALALTLTGFGCDGPAEREPEYMWPQEFDRGDFVEYTTLQPAPESQLIGIQLVQVSWDDGVIEAHEATDRGRPLPLEDLLQSLGYIRHERGVVVLGPWDDRPIGGFNIRHDDAFEFPQTDENGRTQVMEAVWSDRWVFTDLVGGFLGYVDSRGTLYVYSGATGVLVPMESGTLNEAAYEIFDLKVGIRVVAVYEDGNVERIEPIPDRSTTMENLNVDVPREYDIRTLFNRPKVFISSVTARDAQAGRDAAVADLREEYDRYEADPIYHNPDRLWREYGIAPEQCEACHTEQELDDLLRR